MIELKRITDKDDPCFRPLMELYINAFPPRERRAVEQLEDWLITKPQMHFNAIMDNGTLAGLFAYWNFESFYFLEHLAVYAEMRNRKIGQQVLDYIHTHLNKPHILEVEPIEDELTERRVNYYLRNGYEIADKDYLQPSYTDRQAQGHPLWLMAKPAIEKELLRRYTSVIKAIAYIIKE